MPRARRSVCGTTWTHAVHDDSCDVNFFLVGRSLVNMQEKKERDLFRDKELAHIKRIEQYVQQAGLVKQEGDHRNPQDARATALDRSASVSVQEQAISAKTQHLVRVASVIVPRLKQNHKHALSPTKSL